jgi:hypothetical protein
MLEISFIMFLPEDCKLLNIHIQLGRLEFQFAHEKFKRYLCFLDPPDGNYKKFQLQCHGTPSCAHLLKFDSLYPHLLTPGSIEAPTPPSGLLRYGLPGLRRSIPLLPGSPLTWEQDKPETEGAEAVLGLVPEAVSRPTATGREAPGPATENPERAP